MEEKKKRTKHFDRITLDATALATIGRWQEQLERQLKGVSVSRASLIGWLIESHESDLSAQEVQAIEAKFFDQVKFGRWALREFKEAVKRGENVTFAEIVARNQPQVKHAPRKRQARRKADKKDANELLKSAETPDSRGF